MAIRVGINGFGRIGRLTFRAMEARKGDLEVVAINDLSSPTALRHLLKYDSVHGRYPGTVEAKEQALVVNGREVRVLSEKTPSKLPWNELKVDVVVESTGIFTSRQSEKGGYGDHIKAGAKKVVLSAPASDEPDITVVLGVNDDKLTAQHTCLSNASCTTNCIAPMARVLHDSFGIVEGLMTTVHAYTNDQQVNDMIHKDPRRARAAGINIIPTTTGAARAVGKVIPELNGKLNGFALRVPVADGSIVDLVATLKKSVTVADINAAFRSAAEGRLRGILEYSEDPLVSTDIVGNPHSAVFDALSTMTMPENGGHMVKVVAWYDNEWGYASRTVDLVARVAKM